MLEETHLADLSPDPDTDDGGAGHNRGPAPGTLRWPSTTIPPKYGCPLPLGHVAFHLLTCRQDIGLRAKMGHLACYRLSCLTSSIFDGIAASTEPVTAT